MNDTILIVDDEADLLEGLKRSISAEIQCSVRTAIKCPDAIALIKKEKIDLVLTDVCMPEMDGIDLLRSIMNIDPSLTVIMMTAYGTIEIAIECIKSGAYDFIQKPFDEDRLIHLLTKGLERNRLIRDNARLKEKVGGQSPFKDIVGNSAPIKKVLGAIRMLGKTDVNVLILGETGTGKDLAAQAIHAVSNRRRRPMVTVNCPALPESILESELFGYRKGAFTNAISDKTGLFEQAGGSTIFLDEIGDLPLSVQTKLLRVLQDKTIKPLGSNKRFKVDARIIAATNQDLRKNMEEHRLRPDLFYRLNVATITMPPLREIKEDIPLLVEHFLKKAGGEQNIAPKKISVQVLDHILSRDWPGNIRELENTIQGWTALIPEDTIGPQHIPTVPEIPDAHRQDSDLFKSYKELKDRAIEKFTLKYLYTLLEQTGGNVSLSARISGIKRQSLQKVIKRYGIPTEKFRTPANTDN